MKKMSDKIVVEDRTVAPAYSLNIVSLIRTSILNGLGVSSILYKATETEVYDALFSAMAVIKASILMSENTTEENLLGSEDRTKELTDLTISELSRIKESFKNKCEELSNANKKNAQ
jgi:hypothetical protein